MLASREAFSATDLNSPIFQARTVSIFAIAPLAAAAIPIATASEPSGTYVSYSNAGVKGLVEKPSDRSEVVNTLVEKAGGRLLGAFMTTGPHDAVIIAEMDEQWHRSLRWIDESKNQVFEKEPTRARVEPADGMLAA